MLREEERGGCTTMLVKYIESGLKVNIARLDAILRIDS